MENKYLYLFVVQGLWSGWEDETAEENIKEARARLREYRENQPETAHRLIKRRESNPAYLVSAPIDGTKESV